MNPKELEKRNDLLRQVGIKHLKLRQKAII